MNNETQNQEINETVKLYNLKEVARITSLKKTQIYKLIEQGVFEVNPYIKRNRLVKASSVIAFCEKVKSAKTPPAQG